MTLDEQHQYRTKLASEYGQTKDSKLIEEMNRIGLAIDELHLIAKAFGNDFKDKYSLDDTTRETMAKFILEAKVL